MEGVDLRSDTVTQPSPKMRQVMADAEVGDDVLGDDPSVIALQDYAAKLLGKEEALYVPSGTMANAIAIRAHTSPGDEIITEKTSHIYIYEGGGFAAISGCSVALVEGKRGLMQPVDVATAIRKAEGSFDHFPNGSLVCIENTANRGGGTCYPQSDIDEICNIAHENGCKIHMDGARLMNAAVATSLHPARITRYCDTVSICLSKGLGAPVGSILAGDSDTLKQARRWRKMFGGGMRQSGIIAAAGLFALENNIERLADDHAKARRLSEVINDLAGFRVDLGAVMTNMCYIECERPAKDLAVGLTDAGIHLFDTGPNTLRAVTHLDVNDEDIDVAIEAFRMI